MRLLVCGGRDYSNKKKVEDVLFEYDKDIDVLIQGGARGADKLAREWCDVNGVPCLTMHAAWAKYNKSAGSIRNHWMLEYAGPITLVLAFPGGNGTRHMIQTATLAGIPVIIINEDL